MKKYALLLTLALSNSIVLAQETYTVGKTYEIPVDCGYNNSLKPNPVKLHDGAYQIYEDTFAVNSYAKRGFINSDGMTVNMDFDLVTRSQYLSMSLSNHDALKAKFAFKTGENGSYAHFEMGCIDQSITTSVATEITDWENDSYLRLSKTFKLEPRPEGEGEHFAFQVEVEFTQVNTIPMTDQANGDMMLYCQDKNGNKRPNSRSGALANQPVNGTILMSMPMDSFDFEACEADDSVLLEIRFVGGGYRLDGMKALYYEKF